jgi:transcriptional regulator of nitric oxide reductase
MVEAAATQMQALGDAIRSAVAPVFLLSGVGIMLTVLTNRLARTVDRTRVLQGSGRAPDAAPIVNTPEMAESLRRLQQRARLLGQAITLCTICALLISMVVIALFLSAFLDVAVVKTVAVLFIAAMLCFVSALLCFLREVYIATVAIRLMLKR